MDSDEEKLSQIHFYCSSSMSRLEKYILSLITVCLPLQVVSFYVGFSILLVRIVFVIGLLLFLIDSLQKGHVKIPKSFLDYNILVLIIVNFIISIFAINIKLSLKDAFMQLMVIIFLYFIIFIVDSWEQINMVFKVYLITGFLIAILGIYQQLAFMLGWNTTLPFIDYFSYAEGAKNPAAQFWAESDISALFIRIRGTFLDANIFAGYIVSVLGLALSRLIFAYIQGTKKERFGYLCYLIFLIIIIVITMSRSALVGLFLLLITALFYYRRELFRRQIIFNLIFSILFLGSIVLIFMPELLNLIEGVIQSFILSDNIAMRSVSAKLHLKIAAEGVKMFLENPVTGVGLNNFRVVYAHDNAWWVGGFTNKNMMAHSAFISFFAEGGLLGGIANIVIIVLVIFHMDKAIKSCHSMFERSLLVGLFSSYIGILGCNIFYHYYYNEFVWFIMAMNIAAVNLLKKKPIDLSEPTSPSGIVNSI